MMVVRKNKLFKSKVVMNNATYLVILLVSLIPTKGISQFGDRNIISNIPSSSPYSIEITDINGDGDKDVLVSFNLLNQVGWFENIDGQGTFGSLNLVGPINQTRVSFPSDIDNDGDIDVIASSTTNNLMMLFRNEDGQGDFTEGELLLNSEDGTIDMSTQDIDGDNDQDIIFVSFSDSRLGWLENINGQFNFNDVNNISTNTPAGSEAIGGDIDNDGDIDIAVAIGALDTIAWYENLDGLGTFGAINVISNSNDGVIVVNLSDMDGDGDLDIVGASISDQKIAWYENVDGQGTFSIEHLITTSTPFPYTLSIGDLDNDGDNDILSSSQEPDNERFIWFENLDGQGNFGNELVIDNNVFAIRDVIISDIDNDGDEDIFYVDIGTQIVAWYENLTILDVASQNQSSFSMYPNPVSDMLFIDNLGSNSSIELYTISGKLIKSYDSTSSIDVSDLSNGVYLLKISDTMGVQNFKVIKN